MSATTDGGPAFPGGQKDVWMSDSPHGGGAWASSYGFAPDTGMTLRDYFAAKAMQVILHASLTGHCRHVSENRPLCPADYAKAAYGSADAMLAERAKAEGGAK